MILLTLVFIVLAIIILITIIICRKFGQQLKRKLFWNPIIRYTMLSSLKLNLAAMVIFKDGFPDDTMQGVIAIFQLGFFALILPILYARILKQNVEELAEENSISVYGSLYKDLVHENVWTYPLAFFFRRSAFTLATVFLFDRPSLQVVVQ